MAAGGALPRRVQAKVPLATNSYPLGDRKKADLSSDGPPAMIAEMKVTGGWDAAKMQWRVEEDVRRMQQAAVRDVEPYMILLIRDSDPSRKLAIYLDTCGFGGKCERRDWDGFSLKVWRLNAARRKRARVSR